MNQPLLHDYWRSSASYRVRIALALKAITYDRVAVDLVAGAQRNAAHLARNPQGLVPVLEIDGNALTQSLAIIEYLDETRPETPLLPEDAAGRARVRAIADVIAMEIHPLNNLSVLKRIEGLGGAAARAVWNVENLQNGLAAVEALLDHPDTGTFCHGEAPGLAECCLVPQIYNARRWEVDLAQFPRIHAIELACNETARIQSAHPEHFKPA